MESDSAKSMSNDIELIFESKDKAGVWISIVEGLAASGELSPEILGEKGGLQRVKTLAVHAAGLAEEFHSAFVKQGATP